MSDQKNKLTRRLISLFSILLLINVCSCDFAYEKRVIGNYYIIGVDTKENLELDLKLSSGGFVGRVPGRLLEYGFTDTFLVSKTKQDNGSPSYYVIEMSKDSELAYEDQFRIGPISEDVYNRSWKQRLNIQLRKVQ